MFNLFSQFYNHSLDYRENRDPDISNWGCIVLLYEQDDGGAYVSLRNESESRIRAAYPGRTWERLAAIKSRYDPTSLFRLNQNIPPQ